MFGVIKSVLGLVSILVMLLVKGAVLKIIMISTQADFLHVERACFDSQVVLYVDGSLDEDHPLIVEVVGDDLAVLALVLKPGVLCFLFYLGLAYELFQIVYFFVQIFVYVVAFLFRHLQDRLTLRIKNLNIFLAQIQFLSRFVYLLLQVQKCRYEVHIVL